VCIWADLCSCVKKNSWAPSLLLRGRGEARAGEGEIHHLCLSNLSPGVESSRFYLLKSTSKSNSLKKSLQVGFVPSRLENNLKQNLGS